MTAGEWDEAIEAAIGVVWPEAPAFDPKYPYRIVNREDVERLVRAAAPLIAAAALNEAADEAATCVRCRKVHQQREIPDRGGLVYADEIDEWLRERAKEAGGHGL